MEADLTSPSNKELMGDTPLSKYYRQYSGFFQNGRRKIYVNFFHQGVLADEERRSDGFSHPEHNWKWQAEGACDGGDIYLGIQYDIQSRRFEDFESNVAPGSPEENVGKM